MGMVFHMMVINNLLQQMCQLCRSSTAQQPSMTSSKCAGPLAGLSTQTKGHIKKKDISFAGKALKLE